MPTYTFLCDKDKDGCGFDFEKTISFKDFDTKVKKKRITCPKCKKRKPVINVIHVPLHVGITGRTLGAVADRNGETMSEDHKQALRKKHNEYKDTPSTKELPDGMQRGRDLVD